MNTDDLAKALIDSELIVRYIEYARAAHPETMIDEPIEMTAHVWAAALNPFLGGPAWEQACRWRHAQTCDWERGGTSCSCGLLAFQVPLAATPACHHSGPHILPTDNFCADCGAALTHATPPSDFWGRVRAARAATPPASACRRPTPNYSLGTEYCVVHHGKWRFDRDHCGASTLTPPASADWTQDPRFQSPEPDETYPEGLK